MMSFIKWFCIFLTVMDGLTWLGGKDTKLRNLDLGGLLGLLIGIAARGYVIYQLITLW